jgi:EAL and modified HD-GYP domain-containing signal transduction protein
MDMTAEEETSTVAVARQPIFDRSESIAGFEILYRSLTGPFTDAEGATSTVIVQSLADIGLERLVGDSRAYINVTRDFLVKVRPLPMPPERVVLELVGSHEPDPELLDALRDARDAGFRIALDGFRYAPGLEPLLELASVVKLDILALSGSALLKQVTELRGRGLTLIALKVESREEYEACRAMGFDGFQGYFFAEPAVVSGPTAPTHRLGALTELIAPGRKASFEEIERVISQDAGLSHKLVRLASSASIGARQPVSSVRQALILLGTVAVRRWAMLLALSGLSDRPSHLLTVGLVRARLCELLANTHPLAATDRAFTVGLFSVVDALLGKPMQALLDELPFDSRITHALLDHDGPEGRLLAAVLAYERGDFNDVPRFGVGLPALAGAYREALAFSESVEVQLTPA